MLSTKDKKVLKTFDYIIKNKKKDLSPYLSRKLSTMTKLKGGNRNIFYNAVSSQQEFENMQIKYENQTRFNRNEVVQYQNKQYRIKSFLNNTKVIFYNKSLGKNNNGKNIINSVEAEIKNIKKLNKKLTNKEINNAKKQILSFEGLTNNSGMTSEQFLEKSFSEEDKFSENYYEITKNHLENKYFKDEGKSFGGGKSGARIIGFDSGFIFKYSDQAFKKIYHYQDGTIESNRKPLKHYKKANHKVFNTNFKYIRAIREIYLCKKFDELYKENITKARSNSNNNSVTSLERVGIERPKEIVSHRASIKFHNNLLKNQNEKKINIILKKHEENLKKKISKIKLTPEIHYLGFIKNQKIKITKNNNNKKIKLSLEEIPIEKRKGTTMLGRKYTYDTYLPFIVQSLVEGKALNEYDKSDLEDDDNLKIGILYELLLTLSKFKERVEKGKKHIGCHRDMHPGNIFIEVKKNESSGEIIDINARLIDFDLSITNTNNLTVNYQCTRNNLNYKSPLKHTIATTKSWLSNNSTGKYRHDIIDNDNDLYQYMRIYDKLSNIMDDNRHKDILNKIKISLFLENNIAKNHQIDIYDRKFKFINSMLRMIDSYLRLININALNKNKNNSNEHKEHKIKKIKEEIQNKEAYEYLYEDSNEVNKLKQIYPFNNESNKNNLNKINLIIYNEFINYFE